LPCRGSGPLGSAGTGILPRLTRRSEAHLRPDRRARLVTSGSGPAGGGITSFEDVRIAILEPEGKFTFIRHDGQSQQPPERHWNA
jgi:hypothetical protein